MPLVWTQRIHSRTLIGSRVDWCRWHGQRINFTLMDFFQRRPTTGGDLDDSHGLRTPGNPPVADFLAALCSDYGSKTAQQRSYFCCCQAASQRIAYTMRTVVRHVAWSVRLSVCWSWLWAQQKKLPNRWWCRLAVDLWGTKRCIRREPGFPHGKGHLWVLGHASTKQTINIK